MYSTMLYCTLVYLNYLHVTLLDLKKSKSTKKLTVCTTANMSHVHVKTSECKCNLSMGNSTFYIKTKNHFRQQITHVYLFCLHPNRFVLLCTDKTQLFHLPDYRFNWIKDVS